MKKRILLVALFISSLLCAQQFPTNDILAQFGFANGSLLVEGVSGKNLTQYGTSMDWLHRQKHSPTHIR